MRNKRKNTPTHKYLSHEAYSRGTYSLSYEDIQIALKNGHHNIAIINEFKSQTQTTHINLKHSLSQYEVKAHLGNGKYMSLPELQPNRKNQFIVIPLNF